jgi:hypothetical protein
MYLKFIFLFFLSFVTLSSHATSKLLYSKSQELVADGLVSQAYIDFCRQAVAHLSQKADPLPKDRDPQSWNQWSQKNFLRPKAIDHGDLISLPVLTDEHLRESLRTLGLLEAKLPKTNKYDAVVIFGGTPWDTFERIMHVNNLLKKGLSTQAIIYVNGRRELQKYENIEKLEEIEHYRFKGLKKPITYQHEMAEWIWKNTVTDIKQQKLLQVITLEPPKHKDGTIARRIQTHDTVKYILTELSKYKKILFISNNPYGPYQEATLQQSMQTLNIKDRDIEISYSAEAFKRSLAVYTDTLARTLYSVIP